MKENRVRSSDCDTYIIPSLPLFPWGAKGHYERSHMERERRREERRLLLPSRHSYLIMVILLATFSRSHDEYFLPSEHQRRGQWPYNTCVDKGYEK